jgi:hypothetical protein
VDHPKSAERKAEQPEAIQRQGQTYAFFYMLFLRMAWGKIFEKRRHLALRYIHLYDNIA